MIIREKGFTPEVSLIIPNRDRPRLLARVLSAVCQLDYPSFEVIVVGDRPSAVDLELPQLLARDIRYFHCAEANISKARNIGIRAARGEIVAFCDDDGMPERDWLTELVAPFAVADVGGAGGLVRSDNGITVQWSGAMFDRSGGERRLTGKQRGIRLFRPKKDQIEFGGLMGVNTAFRRTALLEIGGFDESFKYYLDETDVALRLTEAGWTLALNPSAEVHHVLAVNASRGVQRRPRSLHQIAASKAYFCKRHTPPQWLEESILTFDMQKKDELDPYVRLGMLGVRERKRLEQELIDGFCDGLEREPALPLTRDNLPFGQMTSFPSRVEGAALSIAIVAGWGLGHGRRMRALARDIVEAGHRASLFQFRSGVQDRSVRFDQGVWVHSGGTWRLNQKVGRNYVIGRAARAKSEIDRVADRTRLRPCPVRAQPAPALRRAQRPGP